MMALLLWTWSEEVDKSDCLNYDGIAIMNMIAEEVDKSDCLNYDGIAIMNMIRGSGQEWLLKLWWHCYYEHDQRKWTRVIA